MMISQKQLLAVLRQRATEVTGIPSDSKGVAAAQQPGTRGTLSDGIELSSQAQDAVHAQRALRDLPEVRQDRVDRIRSAIESDTYRVSAEDVAEKILHRHVIDASLQGQRESSEGGPPA